MLSNAKTAIEGVLAEAGVPNRSKKSHAPPVAASAATDAATAQSAYGLRRRDRDLIFGVPRALIRKTETVSSMFFIRWLPSGSKSNASFFLRSEERRVGRESRSRSCASHTSE